MKREEVGILPAPVGALAARIEAWRRTRAHRAAAMPAELWREAAVLAGRHGVYRISRALGLSYETLRTRTATDAGAMPRAALPVRQGFVELAGLVGDGRAARGEAQTELELVSASGARLWLCHRGGAELDLTGLVEAFCRGGR